MRSIDRRISEGALFTDQYQLSMAQVYFRNGLHDRNARFDYSFRTYPDYGRHQAGYCVFAGLEWLLNWMADTQVTAADIELLRTQTAQNGTALFGDDFLEWLEAEGHFRSLQLDAVPEGRIVHAYAPVVGITGPLAIAQILETSLLNHLNYQTLIATKASRVAESARGGTVLEFGMRRGPASGTNAGTHAALVGGADFSSNVGVSHAMGLRPRGTHAHSMVQVFMALGGGELEAFRAFAAVFPDECVLLVDTIDTLDSGVPNAITVFRELRAQGHEPVGIRLDSGDLAYLAIRSAQMLNAAGFPGAAIVLSSNLDELAIWQILSQIDGEASRYGVDPQSLVARLVYGVGTRLISSHGHSALDGVYKLVAIEQSGRWEPAIKVSESRQKIPIPGRKRLWRIYDRRGSATADVVAGAKEIIDPAATLRLHHPFRPGVARTLPAGEIADFEELLEPVWRGGRDAPEPSLEERRARRRRDLERHDPGVRRLVNPHIYHVSLTDQVKQLQDHLIAEVTRDSTGAG
jgi:nicotinate phosphoribosyltransferase